MKQLLMAAGAVVALSAPGLARAEASCAELKAAKLRTLVLTLNDIPLGITPDNSDYAPVPESRRPAGDPKDDTYYWLHYSLRPKPVPPTDDEKPSTCPIPAYRGAPF